MVSSDYNLQGKSRGSDSGKEVAAGDRGSNHWWNRGAVKALRLVRRRAEARALVAVLTKGQQVKCPAKRCWNSACSSRDRVTTSR